MGAYIYHLVDGKQQTTWVEDEHLQNALQAGGFVDPKVNLSDKHGNVFSVPFDTESLQVAQQEGSRFETPEEYKDKIERREYGEDPLDIATAGVAAGFRGATFGISDAVLAGLGITTPEELAAYQRQNPGIDLTGEILGGALPALASGGASIATTGAKLGVTQVAKKGIGQALRVTPAGQVAKAALKAESSIAGALGGGKLAKAAGAAAAYGAEGAAYGLGHAISEKTIHDRDLISEATLADVGLGALMGGGSVVGLQAVGHGLGSMTAKAKKLIPDIKPGEPGVLSRMLTKTPEDARLFKELMSDAESRALLSEGDSFITHLAEDMSPQQVDDWIGKRQGELVKEGIPEDQARMAAMAESKLETASLPQLEDDIRAALGKTQKHHLELKKDHAREMVQSGNEVELAGSARQLLDEYDTSFAKMREAGQGEYDQRLVKLGQKRGEAVRKEIEGIIESGGQHQNADVWYAIDGLKKDMGTYTKKSLAVRKADRTQVAKTEVFQDLYEKTRQHLENPMHGQMAVNVQAPVNKAFSNYLNQIQADLRVRLVRKGPAGAAWEPAKWVSDPKGFATLTKQLGTPEGKLNTEYFLGQVRARADLLIAIKESYQLTGKDADIVTRAIAATDAIERKLAKATKSLDLMRGMQRLKGESGINLSSAMRFGAPAAVGYAAGGLPLAAGALAARTVVNPSKMVDVLTWADQKAGVALQRMKKSVKSFVGRKKVKVKPALGLTAAITGLSSKDKKEIDKDIQSGYRKVHQQLAALLDPATLERRVKTTGLYLPPDMQETMGMQTKRMVEHLIDVAPKAIQRDRIEELQGKPTLHDRRKIKSWFERLAVASNPVQATMASLNNGTLTGEMVDTLQTLYPKLYSNLVENVEQEIAESDEKIKYQDKVQMSLLLNKPMDSSMEPRFINSMQSMYGPQQSQQPEPGEPPLGAGKRINTGNLMQADIGKQLMTGPQRLESKR